jgi:hypothetical protein
MNGVSLVVSSEGHRDALGDRVDRNGRGPGTHLNAVGGRQARAFVTLAQSARKVSSPWSSSTRRPLSPVIGGMQSRWVWTSWCRTAGPGDLVGQLAVVAVSGRRGELHRRSYIDHDVLRRDEDLYFRRRSWVSESGDLGTAERFGAETDLACIREGVP